MQVLKKERRQQLNLLFIGLLIFLFLMPQQAHAKAMLDPLVTHFASATSKWQPIIFGYASSLFWKLVLVDFTWSTLVWVKDRKELGEILSAYVGKLITYGFFWLMLTNAGSPNACSSTQALNCSWPATIIESFSQIGQAAAKAAGADVSTLDSILFNGFDLAGNMIAALADRDVFERIFLIVPTTFACLCAAIGFGLVAAQLLIAMLEGYIAIYGGIILLGFGGSRWTSDMASSYIKYAIGTGIKLMLCYLVIGLGFNLFTDLIPINGAFESVESMKEYVFYTFHVAAFVVVYVYLVFSIPGIASGMMSGSPNMSTGGMLGAAITAGAAATGAGAVAGSAAKALGGQGSALEGAAKMGSSMVGTPGRGGAMNLNGSSGGGGASGVQQPGSGFGATPSLPGGHAGGLAGDLAKESGGVTSGSPSGAVAEPVTSGAEKSSTPPLSSSVLDLSTSSPSAAKAAAVNSNMPSTSTSKTGGNTTSTGPDSSQPLSGPDGQKAPAGMRFTNTEPAGTGAVDGGGAVGDASGVSVAAVDPHTALLKSIDENMAKMANGPEQVRTVSEKIDQMRRYVPNDGATVSTPGITIGHTRD